MALERADPQVHLRSRHARGVTLSSYSSSAPFVGGENPPPTVQQITKWPDPVVDWAREALQHYAGLEHDEHGADTPKRFLGMLDELTQCKDDSPEHLELCVKWKQFKNDSMDEMIVMTNIPFVSLCNHHVVPFVGKVHVAYIPGTTICGLSKLGRVVRHFARRLQLQERMTEQIASFLTDRLQPLGVAVQVEAEHLCMTIRGVQLPGALTTTSSMWGVFGDHSRTAKAEFLQIVRGGKA